MKNELQDQFMRFGRFKLKREQNGKPMTYFEKCCVCGRPFVISDKVYHKRHNGYNALACGECHRADTTE